MVIGIISDFHWEYVGIMVQGPFEKHLPRNGKSTGQDDCR